MTAAATRIAASLVLASLALSGGCSFVFARGPDRDGPHRYEGGRCTSNNAVPGVDGALGSVFLTGMIETLASSSPGYGSQSLSREHLATIQAGMAFVFVTSAVYGWATVASCREHDAGLVGPYLHPDIKPTRAERLSDEAAEEAAVQAHLKERQAKEAEEAKAAGEAAARTSGDQKQGPPAH